MTRTIWLGALCGLLLAFGSPAEAGNKGKNPVGTWLITVSFPAGGPPPFQELLTFHHNGTLSETNGTLHANPVPGAPFNLTASDGFGSWERIRGGKIRFSFLKMVFCGPGFNPVTDPTTANPADLALASLGCEFPGQQIGYLQVRAEATLRGDTYSGGESFTELLIGPDPMLPAGYIPFGFADSVGQRIPVQAP